jgi:hypothetical protein
MEKKRMNFIKSLSKSLKFAAPGGVRWRHWLAVCVLLGAAAASLANFSMRKAQAEKLPVAFQGQAAIKYLKRQGSYDSLTEAFQAARRAAEKSPASSQLNGQTATANTGYEMVTKLNQPDFVKDYFAKDDLFGYAVAVSGDFAVVGAQNGDVSGNVDRGAAYVFVRYGTYWAFEQKLTAPNGAAMSEFGAAVAIGGDTIVIGAPNHNQSIGSVYVFARTSEYWSLQKELTPPFGGTRTLFGTSVAISGDTIAVGSPTAEKCAVFVRSGTIWNPQTTLAGSDTVIGDSFGTAVSLTGNSLVVGAPRDGTNTTNEHGSAYVFTRTGTTWSQQQKLTASDVSADDNFGQAVAINGETVIVGVPRDDVGTNEDQGSARVFTRLGGVWTPQQTLLANDGVAADFFGYSVAINGQSAAVGAPARNLFSGTAFVFIRNGISWSQQQRLLPNENTNNDIFGFSVSLSGDTVLAAAPLLPASGATAVEQPMPLQPLLSAQPNSAAVTPNSGALILPQGSVAVFTRTGTNWSQQYRLTAQNAPIGEEYFGTSVAISGNTAVIGASGYNDTIGGAFVFVRSGQFWQFQQILVDGEGLLFDYFGFSVAISGDTIAVGAYGDDVGSVNQGSVSVFVRVGNTWQRQQKLTANDTALGGAVGFSVALDGDTLVAGNLTVNSPQSAYVFTRTDGSWSQRKKLLPSNPGGFFYYGQSVAISGNTIIVGSPGETVNGLTNKGTAYVYTGSGANWTLQARLFNPLGGAGGSFGSNVAISGDTLVIGAPSESVGSVVNAGAAYVFIRAGNSWQQQQRLVADVATPYASLGTSVDIKGNRIVVGESGTERIHSFTRTGNNWSPGTPLMRQDPGTERENFGGSIALTDNHDTILVGAGYDYVSGLEGAGSAYVFSAPSSTCNFAISPTNANFTSSGGTGSITVMASDTTCPWAAQSNVSWITLANFGGTGNGVVGYQVAVNGGNQRTGTITIAGQTFTVTQEALVCSVTINPPTLPAGTVGVNYNQPLTATGGTAPYTYNVMVGALPAGLSLTNGALMGTPTNAETTTFTISTTDANGCIATRAYTLTINQAGTNAGLRFYPLARPVRLLDTRAGQSGCDAPGAMIAGGTSRTQAAAGRTCSGLTIPANAKALVGNITTVESGGGHLTLYPSDAAQPLVANSNFGPNEILNNVFTVGLGADGAFKIFVTSSTNVVVDITGYYAPPSAGGLYFHPLPRPIRVLETRQGQPGCTTTGVPIQGGFDQAQLATITCNGVTIPSSARAIVGNATSLNSGAGFLTLYPQGASRPFVASSNFTAGQIMNAPFTVALGAMGEFMIFPTTNTDLVVDVMGYYSDQLNDANGVGLLFNPLPAPVRLLETRVGQSGCYTPGAPLAAGSTRQQQARGACGGQTIAATAQAIVGNATVVFPSAVGYLTFWPNGATQPLVATTNFTSGQVFNRHFTVGLGATGLFNIFAAAQTDLVIDVSGYFAP